MDLQQKIAEASRRGGVCAGLTDDEARYLAGVGHARHVETTGRWVLTDAGHEAARAIEAGEAA